MRVRYSGRGDELAEHRAALKDPREVERKAARGRASLMVLDNYLATTQAGPFIMGEKPTHADSIVYGWYCCSQVNAPVVNPKLWHHESLPRVSAWAEAMKKATGLEVAFPPLQGYAT